MNHTELELIALYHEALEYYKQEEKREQAMQTLQTAAENGMCAACKTLGTFYLSGQYAPYPPEDAPRAVQWIQKAAELGDEEAMYWMGQCYEEGIGVAIDAAEAQKWYAQAEKNGFVPEEEAELEREPAEPEEEEEASQEAKKPEQTQEEPKTEASEGLRPVMADAEWVLRTEEQKKERQEERGMETPGARAEGEAVAKAWQQMEAAPELAPKIRTERKRGGSLLSEEEQARIAAQEQEAQLANRRFRNRLGLGYALICLVGVLLILLLAYWAMQNAIKEYAAWVAAGSGLLVLLGMAGGWYVGIKRAGRRIEEMAEYRKTPFYHAYGCELGHMDKNQSWCYQVYQALAKNYQPVSYRRSVDARTLREYKGLLYPHWMYQTEAGKAQPEFVVVSQKAVYVVHTRRLKGRIQGDLHEPEWQLYSDGEKDLTAEYIPNMVKENDANIAILKGELARVSDLPWESIPFYNVVLINGQVDLRGLRRVSAADEVLFVQGSPDKLRGSLGVTESRLYAHRLQLEEMSEAFAQIGRKFMQRSGW